jgi:ABC-type amino acid transport system permease subunit
MNMSNLGRECCCRLTAGEWFIAGIFFSLGSAVVATAMGILFGVVVWAAREQPTREVKPDGTVIERRYK